MEIKDFTRINPPIYHMPSFRYSAFDPIALDGNRNFVTTQTARERVERARRGPGFPKKLRREIARNDRSARINRYIVTKWEIKGDR